MTTILPYGEHWDFFDFRWRGGGAHRAHPSFVVYLHGTFRVNSFRGTFRLHSSLLQSLYFRMERMLALMQSPLLFLRRICSQTCSQPGTWHWKGTGDANLAPFPSQMALHAFLVWHYRISVTLLTNLTKGIVSTITNYTHTQLHAPTDEGCILSPHSIKLSLTLQT